MQRITIVSNRLPVSLQRDRARTWVARPSSGGLVHALAPVLRRMGGRWIGWPGVVAEECDDATASALLAEQDVGCELASVPLGRREVALYYEGFANSVLWPLFHGMPERCRFDQAAWEEYQATNWRFALRLLEDVRAGDVAWVHDYHLIPLGQMVRRERPDLALGFFLHVPFPRVAILAQLPCWRDILRGLLAYDVIGLQTSRDLHHLGDCIARLAGLDPIWRDGMLHVQVGDRQVTIGVFPIGIDAGFWSDLARTRDVQRRMGDLRDRFGSQTVLLGVDRLDYTKGLLERLAAYELLLERHPELHQQIVLTQVVVPSREGVLDYAALKDELDRRVGRLCGRFATPAWTPVRYIYQPVDRVDLAALYRMADVALVTPVCDGMNLVAKEYCAAQVDRIGALVLGCRAGAAERLGPAGASLVDPEHIAGTAEAILRALMMDPGERRSRMSAMREVVATEDVYGWARSFLGALEAARVGRAGEEKVVARPRAATRAMGTPVTGYPAQPAPVLAAESVQAARTRRAPAAHAVGEENHDGEEARAGERTTVAQAQG